MQSKFAGLLFILLAVLAVEAQEQFTLSLDPGAFTRRNAIVIFHAPQLRNQALTTTEGAPVFVQTDSEGQATLLIDRLEANKVVQLKLSRAASAKTAIQARRANGKIKIEFGSKPLFEYVAGPGMLPRDDIRPAFLRGGYLHPITTLSGKVVTDDYPPNHLHHHGIWWSWTKTQFQGRAPDFWNMGDKKGKTDFVALSNTWSGPVHAGFVGHHCYTDLTAPTPIVALNETWKVTAYAPTTEKYWILDLHCIQTCATNQPLKLPKYHYGGLGFRGPFAWNGKDNCLFLTSNGETDRIKAHATKANWCDIYGEVGGQNAGLAIMGDPNNYRSPQPMRIHPNEPFFCYAPQQDGDMEIAVGQSYQSKYRLVIHDGPPDKALIDELWKDFAEPVKARLVE